MTEPYQGAHSSNDPSAWGPNAGETGTPGTVSIDDVHRIVQQALDRQQEIHNNEMAALRQELSDQHATVMAAFDSIVPEHAGGVGLQRAETWSQHDQELALRGEHPLQADKPART